MRRSRVRSQLSISLDRQLNAYAWAAAAAGVAALALSQPAQAKIVYTPAHKWLPVNQTFPLDLNHDGTNDFKFLLHWIGTCTCQSSSLTVGGAQQGNGVWSIKSTYATWEHKQFSCAAALPKGTKVGPKSPFGQGNRIMFISKSWGTGLSIGGPWLNQKLKTSAYLGFEFSVKGKVHYGWARFGNIDSDGRPPKAKLMGYAYETVPNKPIITGKTKGPDVITVEPGTLGSLALGRK